MTRKRVTRNLKCEFTDNELKKFASDMAQAIHKRDQAKDDLDSVKSQYQTIMKNAEAEMKDAGEKLRSGFEFRNIDCEYCEDHDHGFITVTRLDTHETVESAKMSGKKQLPISGDDEPEFLGHKIPEIEQPQEPNDETSTEENKESFLETETNA